ncbi:RNA polymerase recycling motor HelD [Clostridium boliviensis]|uniref:DNA 3'-5' helicase n=1 Tax=Clostridium boliviensis TaxID=318465 RepID=A0ABU4GNP5_9CLOT|nr:RNA polymerase recycling motor HelD [Clostridium boliviensis]MDW2799240.1 RNA polymerase recycling motor HelD [Clostridium boliviensis]
MSIKEHPDYREEKKRLEDTIAYIKGAIKAAESSRVNHKEEIKQAYVDLDYLDSSQSYASIMLYSTLIEELEKNYDKLLAVKEKPYFARIDFKQEDEDNYKKFYIGKMSLYHKETNKWWILDWRSPLASVYYDGRLGEVTYEAVSQTMKGNLSLKRQYTIENSTLEGIMDVDITATDTFLQASLGENKDNRLKDIVSTIQSEQNDIIRSDISNPLVVQGVAGSGKTTIALHRIAYLIYTYEKSFHPENFMIIAPNRLFLNYISEVLPELGADKVIQTTFTDYIFELIGHKYKLVDSDEKLISIIENQNDNKDNEQQFLVKTASFKGSMEYKDIIDRYLNELEQNFVPDEDFSLEEYVILDKISIKNIFLNEYNHLPIYKRIEQVKKHITYSLKKNKGKILEGIEKFYDEQIDKIRREEAEGEERRLKIVELIHQRDEAAAVIKKSSASLVKKYIAKFDKRDLFEYYRDLISSEILLQKYADTELDEKFLTYMCRQSVNLLDKRQVELEDLSALVYMKHRIFGFEKEIDIKYVVIDEAQDFSHFQFYALKEIFKTQLFTILGDLSQGIHSYRSIQNWDYVLNNIFDSDKSRYLKLEQSYRTTIEIMDLANEVIKLIPDEKVILAKPVVRHGEKPSVIQFNSKDEIISKTEKKVEELLTEGYSSIAIIGKTPRECRNIYKEFRKRGKIKTKLLEGKEEEYDHNIVVVPSYLSKGLEFDAVLIINIEDTYKEEALDLKLLYVSMTRALHRLYVYGKKDSISFINYTDNDSILQ